jgi:predicted amidohydrolase YtcJ
MRCALENPVESLDQHVGFKDRPDAPPEYSGRLGKDPGLSQTAVIQAITRNAAYELHEERFIGSLEVGKLADLIVVDKDPATVPPDQISATKVLLTVVGGRFVYDSGALKP